MLIDNTARVEVRRAAQILADDVVCQESILSFIMVPYHICHIGIGL